MRSGTRAAEGSGRDTALDSGKARLCRAAREIEVFRFKIQGPISNVKSESSSVALLHATHEGTRPTSRRRPCPDAPWWGATLHFPLQVVLGFSSVDRLQGMLIQRLALR